MKTTVVKMLMPVAAFMLASAGAVSTNASHSEKSSAVLVPGFIHSANPCEPSIQCNSAGAFICQTNITSGPQVYGKDAVGPGCAVTLYRP